jgi:hypothetical protein
MRCADFSWQNGSYRVYDEGGDGMVSIERYAGSRRKTVLLPSDALLEAARAALAEADQFRH